MAKRNIIVIGASAGGVQALIELVEQLPVNLKASIFIVLHIPVRTPSFLGDILAKKTKLPVITPKNDEKFKSGCIYVAPANNHILITKDKIKLSTGPTINRVRPAIDPLFFSAAENHGAKTIGIILTGMLDDGTAGLAAIKEVGGITIIQDPDEALHASMPLSALSKVVIDHNVSIAEMVPLLIKLTNESPKKKAKTFNKQHLKTDEIDNLALTSEIELNKIGKVSGFTCPECHGALWEIKNGKFLKYRCRIGHAYNDLKILLTAHSTSLENILWAAVRALEENSTLATRIAQRAKHLYPNTLRYYNEKAKKATTNANHLKQILMNAKDE